jgi:FkbM family methyltransferase
MNISRKLLEVSPRFHDGFRNLKHRIKSPNHLHGLLKGILSQRKGWTFFQAGANDGVLDDPYREFILTQRAEGVLVEPWPNFFQKLKTNYAYSASRLCFLNAAVSYPAERMTFYSLDPQKSDACGLVASAVGLETGLDRAPLEALLKKHGIKEDIIISRKIQGYPIEDLIDIAGYSSVDVLFLDLEGYESVVLQSYDDLILKPKIISFESKHLSNKDDIFRILESRGFKLLHAAKDTVAIREW